MIDRIWILCDFRRRNMRGTSLRRPVMVQRLRQIAVTIKIKLLLCCCIVLAIVFFASRASDLMGWTCDDCSTAVRYSTPRFAFEQPFDLIRSWTFCASLIVFVMWSLCYDFWIFACFSLIGWILDSTLQIVAFRFLRMIKVLTPFRLLRIAVRFYKLSSFPLYLHSSS